MDLRDLLTDVAARYERLGMPAWPDPHPRLAPPRDDEYSRVTDAERYRIVHARARAWVDALHEALGAQVASNDGTTRLVSPRPGTLRLVLIREDVPLAEQEGQLPFLRIAVADPPMEIARLPECGCDACDSGSEDLLETIDSAIASVVGGPFVAMDGDHWHARWHPGGGSASAAGYVTGLDDLMDLCRRVSAGEAVDLPTGTSVVVGRSWLS